MYYVHCREFVPSKGAGGSPLKLNINFSTNTSPTLTWQPPATHAAQLLLQLHCQHHQQLQRTEQVYNSTLLTLASLTRGENYSFAVAVTDSRGQHGASSEELNVAWNGEYNNSYILFALVFPFFSSL